MSDASAFGFGKFVPGFDFLQSLAAAASAPKAPGSATAGMSSWVAPTLNVEELDKRIQELKAVQFWLEQNGTALKATIQALEVQKMTLSTLQGMNVNMAELTKAFTVSTPVASEPAQAQARPASTAQPQPKPAKARSAQRKDQAAASVADKGAAVDPMQWWGSLTQQFQNIAAAALQDAAAKAPQASAAATSGSDSAPASGPRAAKPSPSKPATATKAKRPASRSRRA